MVNQSQFIEMFGEAGRSGCTRTLQDYATISGGFAFKSNLFHSNGVPIIRISNINDGLVSCDMDVCYDHDFWQNNASFRVEINDILIAMSGATTGKSGIYKCSNPALLNQRVARVRAKKGISTTSFVYVALQLESMYEAIQERAQGNAQPNISGHQIETLPMPNATFESQMEFDSIVHQADKSKFAGFKSQFISQFGFPQDGDVKHPISSIESLLEETISGEWGTDCVDDSGTRVIRTTNFTNDGVLNLDDVVLRSIDQKKVEKKHLHKGDIILEKSGGTKDNPVGRLVYFAEDGIYLANNFTQVLRPSNSVNSRYLFVALYYLYQTHKPLIKGLGNQTNGIQNLKVPQYLQLQVCVPDRKEQDAFEEVLQHADKSTY